MYDRTVTRATMPESQDFISPAPEVVFMVLDVTGDVIVTVAKDIRSEGGPRCLVLGSVVTVMIDVRNGSEIGGEFKSIVMGSGSSVTVMMVVGSPPLLS